MLSLKNTHATRTIIITSQLTKPNNYQMAAAKTIFLSRATTFAFKHTLSPPQPLFFRHKKRQITSLISGVDGGGVSDEFVSTRKSSFGREFLVLANMLKTIEPLDNSVIVKGVSESSKDSMKQTISTMLGILPSDSFSVMVSVSKGPLDRLLVSSLVTGYTLWNAEYRVSLMRNFGLSLKNGCGFGGVEEVRWKESDNGGGELGGGIGELERMSFEKFGDLSNEALSYVQQLELELSEAKQELHAHRQENVQMEHMKTSNNNLLEYLRSLEPEIVSELSRASSPEVEEIIQQLAQNILQRFFKDEMTSEYVADSALGSIQNHQAMDNELCDTVGTSRDYLAKLLFWCMLMGHHLRGLENRLHLSCAVGLL